MYFLRIFWDVSILGFIWCALYMYILNTILLHFHALQQATDEPHTTIRTLVHPLSSTINRICRIAPLTELKKCDRCRVIRSKIRSKRYNNCAGEGVYRTRIVSRFCCHLSEAYRSSFQTVAVDQSDRIKALATFAMAFPTSHKKIRKKHEVIYPILSTECILRVTSLTGCCNHIIEANGKCEIRTPQLKRSTWTQTVAQMSPVDFFRMLEAGELLA